MVTFKYIKYLFTLVSVKFMAKSLSRKKDIPMCICGHDIFYHDMRVTPHIVGYISADKIHNPTNIAIGKCNENDGEYYTCKCKQFNSIDMWMNELWEEMKQYGL